MNTTSTSFRGVTNGALFAAILGNVETARHVEDYLSKSAKLPTIDELCKIRGIGKKTAEKVLACCELSAAKIVEVCGGWICFETLTDFETWRNQK